IYCGKLAKNTNCGVCVGNCIQNLMLIYFPFTAGGGLFSIIGNITSLNLAVEIRFFLFSNTFTAVSNAFNKRCLVSAETNKIGTSSNGAICSLILFSYSLVVWLSFSTKSHLFTRITTPFLFFCANQKILWSCPSNPRVASITSTQTSACSMARTERITE